MAFSNYNDNSESSTAEDHDLLSSEERNAQVFSKQMLQGRLFLGHFQEKRRVEPLQGYRDVVVVSESEAGLINDMKIVRQRLRDFYPRDYWIGITEPTFVGAPNGYSFWTEIHNNTFGKYWFKIKHVRFRRKEVIVKLQTVRAVTDNDLNMENTAVKEWSNDQIKLLVDNLKNTLRQNVIWLFTEALTGDNIKQAFMFLSVFIVTLATSAIYGIQYLMEFSVKFMRELSVFIQACSPVLIAIVNLVGKIIGGFYLLIAMMWRGEAKRTEYPRIMYRPQMQIRAIGPPPSRESYRRQPLTITEIN